MSELAPTFEIFLNKQDMKFNCAHFICHRGFRERLHGHNYSMTLSVVGQETISTDGYLIDFGDLKRAARDLCKSMNEFFICPMLSDCMTITETEDKKNLCLQCEDGSVFSFPIADCARLPIVHSSVEEMTHYIWFTLVKKIGVESLRSRGITRIEIAIAEAPGQTASYKRSIPATEEELEELQKVPIIRQPSRCFDDI